MDEGNEGSDDWAHGPGLAAGTIERAVDGAIDGVVDGATDADDALRERIEHELRVKNRAMDDTDLGITISTPSEDGLVLEYINDGFERLTGYDEDAVRTHGWELFVGEGSDEDTIRQVMAAATEGRSADAEVVSYRASGAPFWNHLRITPIEDESGTVTHVVGFNEDVTERKRSAVLFSVLNRVLRHNLRNQMTVLHGYAERIEDVAPDERAAVADGVRTVVGDLTEVSDRAQELESYARSDAVAERLALGPLLERAVEGYAPSTTSVSVDLSTDLDVCAGPSIERALGELIENAGVHDDDPPTAVAIDATDDGRNVKLTITDDGPGIPSHESAVFQAGRETPLAHSGGLGLWLVNWLVTRFGGSFQIRAASGEESDGGTVATVRLPAIAADQDVSAVARSPTPLFE